MRWEAISYTSCQRIVSSLTYWRKFVPTEQPVIPGLLGAHLAGDGQAVVLAVLVVALDIEVGEIDGDPERNQTGSPLIICDPLPLTTVQSVLHGFDCSENE